MYSIAVFVKNVQSRLTHVAVIIDTLYAIDQGTKMTWDIICRITCSHFKPIFIKMGQDLDYKGQYIQTDGQNFQTG